MLIALGTRRGPYEIIASLRACGMSVVNRARDARLNRDAAVKLVRESYGWVTK